VLLLLFTVIIIIIIIIIITLPEETWSRCNPDPDLGCLNEARYGKGIIVLNIDPAPF
jgi:hypothetical protein